MEINKKSTSKALFKNTGIIAIGQISTKIVNFFLLPLYTALLTTEEYGLVDIPVLLQYYLPGLWTITVFKYFCSKEIQTESQTILACVVSYVLLSISDLLSNIPFLGVIKNSVLGRSGISIILGTLLALLVSSIFCAKWFSKVMVTLFHKTPNDNIWRDVLDLTHGSNLKLYIRDANYYIIGHHRNIEEKGDDSWIVLTEFIKHSKDDNRVIETHDGKEKDMIAIRLSDVEYAEIFN